MRGQKWCLVALSGVFLATPFDQPIRADSTVVPAANQDSASAPPDPSQGVVYICPMDPDVRSHQAGVCRRCGMSLVSGIADPAEFHLDLSVIPRLPAPGRPAVLQFLIRDPWKDRPVSSFNVVHERLFHTFVVSEDLEFFEHGHPRLVADGVFQYPMALPKPGMYRVLGDYYPAGAMPQLTSDTIVVPGASTPAPVHLGRDYSTKRGTNIGVSFATIPEEPVATVRTQLRLTIDADHGLQRYLGAWAHMLAASQDLIDMMHEHPLLADGGPQMEFEIVFPREGAYRIWLQFQSDNVVNTVHFDVPVAAAPRLDE
jgi:heavy metal-binding protein